MILLWGDYCKIEEEKKSTTIKQEDIDRILDLNLSKPSHFQSDYSSSKITELKEENMMIFATKKP